MKVKEKLDNADRVIIILTNIFLTFPVIVLYPLMNIDPELFFGLVFIYFIDKCFSLSERIITDKKIFNLQEKLEEHENKKIH